MSTEGIITYGGGETLVHVFNAVATLMNGNEGKIFRPMMLIGAMVGAVWAFGQAFWESSVETLFLKWLIPMVAIVGICIIPSTTVHIHDPILNLNRPIDNVPLGLARSAQTISTIGYGLTKAVEYVFAVPGNFSYSKTGMIFGSDNLLEMSRYAITNERLAGNMRDFVHNCVTFDVTFRLYSMDELKRSKDIWGLIRDNTSRVRMFTFCEAGQRRCNIVSCRDGTKKLEDLLKQHCDGLKAHHILKEMPSFYQHLVGLSTTATDMIFQQVMMHSIIDATERKCDASGLGTNFAVRRAYMQQRHTYEVVGALAAKSLVVLRNVFEALIYVAFIFIMPFALLPMGFRIFLKWLWLLVWIQLWPPFYAILHSGIMLAAKTSAQHIVGIDKGLTFMTSTGLHNLALDMETYAAYASLSVPFIAYAILQGGVQSLVQMASSITGVSQSVGGSAAAEQTSGNYSYGQVGLNTVSAFNETMMQYQKAPSLSMGYTREDYGDHSIIQGGKRMIVNESMSQLAFELNASQHVSGSLRKSAEDAASFATQDRESLAKSVTSMNRELADWTEHKANNKSYSASIAHGTNKSVAEVSQEAWKLAESFGKKHGHSTKKSFDILAGVSSGALKLFGFEAGATYKVGTAKDKVTEDAKLFAHDSGFSKAYQSMVHSARNEQINNNDEKGQRLSHNIAQSYDQSQNHQKQMEKHTQKAESLRRSAERVEQNSVGFNEKLNNEFVDGLANERLANGKIRGRAGAQYIIHHSPYECKVAAKRFLDTRAGEICTNPALATEAGFDQAKGNLMARSTQIDHNIQRPVKQELKLEGGKDIDAKEQELREKHDKNDALIKGMHEKSQTGLETENHLLHKRS